MDAQEELAFIRKVMTDSRDIIQEDGKMYLIWGICMSIACGSVYFDAAFALHIHSEIIFMLAIVIGVGFSIREGMQSKAAKPESFASRINGAIWAACGCAMIVVAMIMPILSGFKLTGLSPMYVSPLISLILGIAYFICGTLYELKWMRYLALLWWLGAIGMFMMDSVAIMGVFALMLVALEVVPGFIFYRRARNATIVTAS